MNVLLVDDHPLILSALQTVIEGLSDNVKVIGASSARAARQTLQDNPNFDLMLLDLQLGDANGFDVLAEMRETYPSLPVVVVSASDRASDVIRSIDLGAMGFVPKRATHETLFEALRLVMSGGIYVPPMSLGADATPPPSAYGASPAVSQRESVDAAPSVMQLVQNAASADYQTTPSLSSLGLTPRQNDVLALLLQGKPNKIIARELGLAVETVKDHVAAVLRALGVTSRTQAVLAVSQMAQQDAAFQAWKPTD